MSNQTYAAAGHVDANFSDCNCGRVRHGAPNLDQSADLSSTPVVKPHAGSRVCAFPDHGHVGIMLTDRMPWNACVSVTTSIRAPFREHFYAHGLQINVRHACSGRSGCSG
jgi:hypothetical protein